MKKAIVMVCGVLAVSAMMAAAEEMAAAPATVTVAGTVVCKVTDGNLEGVSLMVAGEPEAKMVAVVMDDQGKALQAMDGKAVEATGVMVKEGEAEMLKVEKAVEKAVEAPAADAAPEAPAVEQK
jgi:hypothetical protein